MAEFEDEREVHSKHNFVYKFVYLVINFHWSCFNTPRLTYRLMDLIDMFK